MDYILALGHNVVVIDDFSNGQEINLQNALATNRLVIIKQDIAESVENVFAAHEFAAVFHLAAIASGPYSVQNPAKAYRANVDGALNVLESCRLHKVIRFVFSSSAAIYGNNATSPCGENEAADPLWPYALHKLTVEQYARLYSKLYGLETICLRYFNVFGERQRADGDSAALIPKCIARMRAGEVIIINGNGEQTRDLVAVSDVVEANWLAATTTNQDCFGEALNIGSGKGYSVNEIVNTLAKQIGGPRPNYGPEVLEVKNSLANIDKAKKLLGWEPKANVLEKLKELAS